MLELFVGWKYKILAVSQVSILANPVVSSSCLLSVSCSSTVSSLLSSPFGWAPYTQYTSWHERGSSTFHFTMFCISPKAMFALLSVISFFYKAVFFQSNFLKGNDSRHLYWFTYLRFSQFTLIYFLSLLGEVAPMEHQFTLSEIVLDVKY